MINNPNSPMQGTPYPGFPPSPPRNPRGNLWIWIIGALAIIVVIGVIATFALTNTRNSPSQASAQATATAAASITPTAIPATPTASSNNGSPGGQTGGSSGGSTGGSSGGAAITAAQAVSTVNLYYGDINAKNYQSAYDRWGNHYRSSVSYQTFAQGFANTQKDGLQIGTTTQLADGTIKVPVTVTANVSSGGSITVNTYQGYYVVGVEGGQPHLLNANLQLTNSSKDSVKRAVSLLEQYYADINAQNYSNAYSIWGSAYQKTTSSYQFAKGFSKTKSVSININYEGIVILNDGSVKVPLTITSMNTDGTHTYQGYYIIGMENEVWHLLSANIQ